MPQISGQQAKMLRDGLIDAFPTTSRLDEMLLHQLDVNRQRIALGDDLDEIVRKVIGEFNRNWEIPKLIQAGRAANPHNPVLATTQQDLARPGVAVIEHIALEQQPIASGKDLERFIKESNGLKEPRQWRERMARAESAVCRVEILQPGADPILGTGFLVAPDLVITNYHVIELIHKGVVLPTNVQLRFDFALLADGVTPDQGTIYRLDQSDWLVDYSTYSELDTVVSPLTDPLADQLDYALLRVNDSPGDDPVGGVANQQESAGPRGFLPVPSAPYTFATNSALFILQHPAGTELKLALDTEAVIGVNGNRTRVRYRTNTDEGSSGSPCFDDRWNLVALHHAGDPKFAPLYHPQYNQGIPFAAIRALLEQRNKLNLLPT
jgi:Trypsin-like peptidase domain/Effector-associated domain 1